MGFVSWIAKEGVIKGHPKNTAQLYVKIREHQPNLNIYAVIDQIIRVRGFAWSFSRDQTWRILSQLNLIAFSEHDLSDYQVLLKFCSYLPYVASNRNREETNQDIRRAFHEAVLEGLNKGLGSFKHKAKSLKTTKNKEGLEHHPIFRVRDKKKSNSISEKADNSKQEKVFVSGTPEGGSEISEEIIESFPDVNYDLKEELVETSPDGGYELSEWLIESFPGDKSQLSEEVIEISPDGNSEQVASSPGYKSELADALTQGLSEESPFFSDFQRIGEYIDWLYPPFNNNEFSVRNFDLPKHHVLFIHCFNGSIHSQSVHFSEDTTELHFHLPNPKEIIDTCLTDEANDKVYFHLCLSLLNSFEFHDRIRSCIYEGLVPVVYVIANGDDRTVRLASLARV